VSCGTLLGTRRWIGSTGEGGIEFPTEGPGEGPPLAIDDDGSRVDGWARGGYGELGNGRFLNVNGVVSAGPRLPPEVFASLDTRGGGRLKAAAEMVRVPGGSGAEARGEEDLLIGPVAGDMLVRVGGRMGDSEGVRSGDSIGVRYPDPVLVNEGGESERSGRLIFGGGIGLCGWRGEPGLPAPLSGVGSLSDRYAGMGIESLMSARAVAGF
jgi:hypothetical protein